MGYNFPKMSSMKILNIGPKSTQWLNSVGIFSITDLEKLGAVKVFKIVKSAYPHKVTLNLLYALQGALLDLPWNEIPHDIKEKINAQVMETYEK